MRSPAPPRTPSPPLRRSLRDGLRAVVRSLVPGALVLLYHRVADEPCDPDGLCVSPAAFAGHLASLRRRGVRLTTAAALARALREGRAPPRAAAITFDDGYLDNLEQAKPLLERYEVPATVFVTAGRIGSGREFWWDSLARICLGTRNLPDVLSLTVAGREHRFDLGAASRLDGDALAALGGWRTGEPAAHPRQVLYRDLWAILFRAAPAEREALTSTLLSWAGLPEEARATHRTMTADQVARLAAGALVDVGAHSWSHPALAGLAEEAQRDELVRSKARLEAILGRPVVGCSHPHGRYTAVTTRLVRGVGYAYACTSTPRLARRGADPFEIPRIVVENWPAPRFARFVADYLRV